MKIIDRLKEKISEFNENSDTNTDKNDGDKTPTKRNKQWKHKFYGRFYILV